MISKVFTQITWLIFTVIFSQPRGLKTFQNVNIESPMLLVLSPGAAVNKTKQKPKAYKSI